MKLMPVPSLNVFHIILNFTLQSGFLIPPQLYHYVDIYYLFTHCFFLGCVCVGGCMWFLEYEGVLSRDFFRLIYNRSSISCFANLDRWGALPGQVLALFWSVFNSHEFLLITQTLLWITRLKKPSSKSVGGYAERVNLNMTMVFL